MPERQYGSCNHAQSKMAASSASSGENSKSMDVELKQSPELSLNGLTGHIRAHFNITAI